MLMVDGLIRTITVKVYSIGGFDPGIYHNQPGCVRRRARLSRQDDAARRSLSRRSAGRRAARSATPVKQAPGYRAARHSGTDRDTGDRASRYRIAIAAGVGRTTISRCWCCKACRCDLTALCRTGYQRRGSSSAPVWVKCIPARTTPELLICQSANGPGHHRYGDRVPIVNRPGGAVTRCNACPIFSRFSRR